LIDSNASLVHGLQFGGNISEELSVGATLTNDMLPSEDNVEG
jgi:hypothetical protein